MRNTNLLFLTMLAFISLSFGQEPTYEQTRKWILRKITEDGGQTTRFPGNKVLQEHYLTESYENVSMDECKLEFTRITFSSAYQTIGIVNIATPSSVTTESVSVPLDKVSTVDVKHHYAPETDKIIVYDYQGVEIYTSTKAIAAKETEKTEEKITSQEIKPLGNIAFITFGRSHATDEDLANRMQKALNHAVALCERSKEKEPF